MSALATAAQRAGSRISPLAACSRRSTVWSSMNAKYGTKMLLSWPSRRSTIRYRTVRRATSPEAAEVASSSSARSITAQSYVRKNSGRNSCSLSLRMNCTKAPRA